MYSPTPMSIVNSPIQSDFYVPSPMSSVHSTLNSPINSNFNNSTAKVNVYGFAIKQKRTSVVYMIDNAFLAEYGLSIFMRTGTNGEEFIYGIELVDTASVKQHKLAKDTVDNFVQMFSQDIWCYEKDPKIYECYEEDYFFDWILLNDTQTQIIEYTLDNLNDTVETDTVETDTVETDTENEETENEEN